MFLVRQEDFYRVPYDVVDSMTLIALLRMGLLAPIRDRFFDFFLTLPLYEDMAPWNIVFRQGRLDYIDYDTKDVTFTKMVPYAYQVI